MWLRGGLCWKAVRSVSKDSRLGLRGFARSNPARRRCAVRPRGCRILTSRLRARLGRGATGRRPGVTAYSLRKASTTSATMCEVWGQMGARSSALTQRHAGDVHGAVAVPLHDAAGGFFADSAGAGDFEDFLIEHGIERASRPPRRPWSVQGTAMPMARAHSRAREAAVVSLPPMTEIRRAAPSGVWSCRK